MAAEEYECKCQYPPPHAGAIYFHKNTIFRKMVKVKMISNITNLVIYFMFASFACLEKYKNEAVIYFRILLIEVGFYLSLLIEERGGLKRPLEKQPARHLPGRLKITQNRSE